MAAPSAATHRDEFLADITSVRAHTPHDTTGIEFHDVYLAALDHQRQCSPLFLDLLGDGTRPARSCLSVDCLSRSYERALATSDREAHRVEFEVCRRWAWAVPNTTALTAIAQAAPDGVVEIGAGAGYWAYELGRRGVDVRAYDPTPPEHGRAGRWHTGYEWHPVRRGDHSAASTHPDRTLLVCWPEHDAAWAAAGVIAYHQAGGTRVIYVGEGPGGMTGDAALHTTLGITAPETDPPADAPRPARTLFSPAHTVAIPQWANIHDALTVCERIEEEP